MELYIEYDKRCATRFGEDAWFEQGKLWSRCLSKQPVRCADCTRQYAVYTMYTASVSVYNWLLTHITTTYISLSLYIYVFMSMSLYVSAYIYICVICWYVFINTPYQVVHNAYVLQNAVHLYACERQESTTMCLLKLGNGNVNASNRTSAQLHALIMHKGWEYIFSTQLTAALSWERQCGYI